MHSDHDDEIAFLADLDDRFETAPDKQSTPTMAERGREGGLVSKRPPEWSENEVRELDTLSCLSNAKAGEDLVRPASTARRMRSALIDLHSEDKRRFDLWAEALLDYANDLRQFCT
ncbi:MAG: hypothetical protein V4479_11720 [Actinomycetota bacterium]